MNTLLYILLRRLRMPLLVLIGVYAVSTLGLVLIPGQDSEGNLWRMDFFHAFYFVSFMGSTIGFGEVPYEFTDAQRMWTLFCIYSTVLAWLYGIGATLAIVQDPSFIRLLRTRRFSSQVRGMKDPFYLICGYGTTGREVVHGLEHRGIRSVVIDREQSRIDLLETDELVLPGLGLCGDASVPEILDLAGLQHKECLGVLALTNDDSANLSIAIASKLLFPRRLVISRSENDITTANMASFGTDLIINPFRQFADYLGLAVSSPHRHLVYDWLMHPHHRPLSSVYKHATGRWILCGYGRFGRALSEVLSDDETHLTLIDINPDNLTGIEDAVLGVGTESVTLQEARVEEAVGIVAGTANDADNLSIIMTARELNPKLTTVVRQNQSANDLIFSHSKADFVMQPGQIIATRILAHIRTPLLREFLDLLYSRDEVWAHTLMNRLVQVVGDDPLDSRNYTLDPQSAPAIVRVLEAGNTVSLRTLMKSPHDRTQVMSCFPLLLKREGRHIVMPGELEQLALGDKILFCGRAGALSEQSWALENESTLNYLLTGEDSNPNPILRLIRKRYG